MQLRVSFDKCSKITYNSALYTWEYEKLGTHLSLEMARNYIGGRKTLMRTNDAYKYERIVAKTVSLKSVQKFCA